MRKWFFVGTLIIIAVSFGAFFAFSSSEGFRDNNGEKPLGMAALAKTAFHFITETSRTLTGESDDRINILLLGLPGEQNDAPDLTDTIIVASIKPSTRQLALLSIPRDLLVELDGGASHAKINALYRLGGGAPSLIKQKMEEITGQPIHYFATLDISSIEQIVDALGGLNVAVADTVYDSTFPTAGGGTELFSVQKGWRYFNGATAQKYLRTRHGEGGDFARMRRQQAVIEAVRKKVFGLNMLYDFPTVLSLYKTIRYHVQTDIDETDMRRFYDIAKTISYATVRYSAVDGDPANPDALLESATVTLEGKPAFVLKPKTGDFDYADIQTLAGNIFEEKF